MAAAGIGGSNGSTTASTIAGLLRGERRLAARAAPPRAARSGSPTPPHASANLTKSIGCSVDLVLGVAQEDHLLPLDLAERVVLDDDDLDRQLVLDRRGELAHQHREAAVADERDDLPVGIGGLGADGVGQAGAIVARLPEQENFIPRRMWMCRAAQVVIVPESVVTIASSLEQLVDVPRDDLRLDRRVVARLAGRASAPSTPSSRSWAFSRNERSFLRLEQRQQRLERRPGVADQADVDRVAQADPRRVDVDLDAPWPGPAWDTTCR